MGLLVCWNRTKLAQRLCCTSVIQRPSMRSYLSQRSLPVNMRWWCWLRCSAHTQSTGRSVQITTFTVNIGLKGINPLFSSRWHSCFHLTVSKLDMYPLQVQVLPRERHLLPGSDRLPSAASAARPVRQGARGAAKTAFQRRHRDQRRETRT